jgi:hypothetical protein
MMIKILEERNFDVTEFIPVASEKSVGNKITFKGNIYDVISIEAALALAPDLAIFSAGGNVSLAYAEKFAAIGTVVIDNSSAWRMHKNIKLVVPEVNDGLSAAAGSKLKEFTTSTGKILVVDETHPIGASLSNFTAYFKGDTTTRLTLTDMDPASNMLTADLDSNGYDELYIFTTAAGSGAYGKVCGFTSNKDLSLSFLYFPELEESDLKEGQPYHGYEGHDVFSIEGKRLVRKFPVAGEKGNMRTIKYALKKTEGGLTLVAEK